MKLYTLTCISCHEERQVQYSCYIHHKSGRYGGRCKKCTSKENTSFGKVIPWNKGTGIATNSGRTRFNKGMTPWNKGLKGYNSGDNHYNWQGGKSSKGKAIRQSLDYKAWRKSVFTRDEYTCQGCGTVGGWLEADHIKPFSLFPDLRFDLNNGRTLCKPCHLDIGWNLFKEDNPRKRKGVT